MTLLCEMYATLRERVRHADLPYCGIKDTDDLLHDTILTVAQDAEARTLTGQQLEEFFMYRFNMVLFQNVKDYNSEHMRISNYADDLQKTKAKENLPE